MQVRRHSDAEDSKQRRMGSQRTPCPDMPFCVFRLSLRIAKTAHIPSPFPGCGHNNPTPGLTCEEERRPLAGRAPSTRRTRKKSDPPRAGRPKEASRGTKAGHPIASITPVCNASTTCLGPSQRAESTGFCPVFRRQADQEIHQSMPLTLGISIAARRNYQRSLIGQPNLQGRIER
jgi:hypothetical protein